jgi:lipopolysaccharide transport protein LptA/LPS export ABC transporter protein LptC
MFEFATDRTEAFRAARRHSTMVRVLRLLLPVTAVALLGSYGLFMQRSLSISFGQQKLKVDAVSISTQALVAHNPRYEGFDKQGGKFVVHAKTAEQDLKQTGPVRLNEIDGKLTDANNVVTDLTARRGTFDTNTQVLELHERIDVASQNGMAAQLTQATVYAKEGRIESSQQVIVKLPSGVVRGNRLTIEQKKRIVLFSNGVSARLKPEPRKPKGSGESPAAQTASAAGPLGRSDEPVDIVSATLRIDDNAKLAVFSGNVIATQGEAKLETAELEVSYVGQPAADGKAAAPGQPGSGKVKTLRSNSPVVLTRGTDKATGSSGVFDAEQDKAVLMGPVVVTSGADRQATGDRADIDNKNETALLTGNVVVTQQKNVLKGQRLFLDRKRATMQMTSPGGPGQAKSRISAKLYQADDAAAGKKTRKPIKTAQTGDPGLGATLRADPDQPTEIEADALDVDDRAKTATFRGKVRTVQGDYTMYTDVLVATYSGEAGMAIAGEPPGNGSTSKTGAKGGAKLTKVTAPQKVLLVAKDGQRATGNQAEFDTQANIVTLIGDVTLSQNGAVTHGPKAVLDLNTNRMRMIEAAAAGFAAVKGVPVRRERVQLMLQPDQLKQASAAAKAKARGGTGASSSPAVREPPAPAPVPQAARPPSRPGSTSGGWLNDAFSQGSPGN